MKRSRSPIQRNLGFVASRDGLEAANDLVNRNRNISYDYYEAIKYRDSEFMQGIREMYKYGVTGSIVAVAGSPIFLEGIFQTIANSTGLNIGIEAGWQAGNSLLYNGDLSQVDLVDIGFSTFRKYGFAFQATFDYSIKDGFTRVGGGKNSAQFGTDILIGRFNKWHVDAMGVAGVEKSVINMFNRFNGNLRNTVGTGIKEGVKDE